ALTRIDALRTGELSPAEQGAVRNHLRTCRSCDESLGDLDRLAKAVRTLALTPPGSLKEALDGFDRVTQTDPAVWVAFTHRGIRMIRPAGSEAEFRSRYARRHGRALVRRSLPKSLLHQVVAALHGDKTGKPSVDLGETSPIEEEVLQALLRVPR